jgi:hypothetical protein
VILKCKRCQHDFHATKQRRVYCGRACKEAATRKIDLEKLKLFVFQGREGKEMAAEFGVSGSRIHRVLHHYGLHEQWLEQRYA